MRYFYLIFSTLNVDITAINYIDKLIKMITIFSFNQAGLSIILRNIKEEQY